MAAISGIEPVAAPHPPQRHERDNRAPAEFGAAVTHRDLVAEKLRVDPAALADKKRASDKHRGDSRQDRLRDERLAQQDAAYGERKAAMGSIVDIET